MTATNIAALLLALTSAGQAPVEKGQARDESAERLRFMKQSLEAYRLSAAEERGREFRLQAEPAFRLGNQFGEGLLDGAIFFWLGETGRPEAAVQVFLIKNASEPQGLWLHEFTSLAPGGLLLEKNGGKFWYPSRPGAEFKPVPDAPKVAERPAQRLIQMREMARGFKASDNFGGRGWVELRSLPTPISRYGKPGSGLADGALFAFVHGTDPEVFLFLEAREGKGGVTWQYAFAPQTVFAVKGSLANRQVWELPDRQPAYDPSRPFFDISYVP
jgi:hypothetical protein